MEYQRIAPPGWEGSVGPFKNEYGMEHVYARDIHSGAGNCVCGRDLGHRIHLQAAPGVPIPESMRPKQQNRRPFDNVGTLSNHIVLGED